MKKIIFVAGSPHSGTTLLNLLLGSHPQIAAYGEITKLIDESTRDHYINLIEEGTEYCTCKNIKTKDCPFWKSFLKEVELGRPFADLYQFALEYTANKIDGNSAMVDSTKTLIALSKLVNEIKLGKLKNITLDDIIVIHVMKDLRAYLKSSKVRYKVPNWHIPKLIYYAFRWEMVNKKIIKYVKDNNISYHHISYEKICFNLKSELESMCLSLGCDYSDKMADLDLSNSHTGLGNPKRVSTSKSKKVSYDSRWFYDFGVNFCYMVSRGPRIFNEEMR
ncbi:MAG: hypothetical protein CL961_00800 [Euryarchaeota archaeon]|nr:hypothetical protein [Euryarchaeota archaeon]|tara:strand:- start:6776 stop:7606 length:831 start_codon:yes stop_codon:yes gene_type:complete